MGREEKAIQEELAQFVGSIKDTSPMLHSKPRFLYHQSNFDMEIWNQKNYIELFYASDYVEVGNEYDWSNSKQIKVDITFSNWWVHITVGGIKWDEEELPILAKFVKENNLEIIKPLENEAEEEDASVNVQALMSGLPTGPRQSFVIDSFLIFNVALIKDALLTIDNQLNNYSFGGI